jgi:hypothetical protein
VDDLSQKFSSFEKRLDKMERKLEEMAGLLGKIAQALAIA